MDDSEPADPQAALVHYRQLVASLTRQVTEAENDIRDYTESSKELQDELEKELGRMEKSEKDLVRDLEKERGEAESWKTKYTTALREHTTTITHMQRELESLRTSEKALRTKLRDMELDNDDLEKSEREKDTTLQDLENRYGRSIERIALLEEELVTKAQLEEDVQRLKDELRDLGEENAVLKTSATPAYPRPLTPSSATPSTSTPAPLPRPLSITPPPAAPSSPFSTPPRKASPPAISLVSATPAPPSARPSSPPTTTISPPLPPIIRAPVSSGATALARSTKTKDLAATATSATPRLVRQQRAEGMINDMKVMTDRVKQLTSRLDSRRNLVMAGSAIPRASMSPASASASAGLGKSVAGRRPLGQSQLGGGSGLTARLQKEREANLVAESGVARPASRSGMRMSIGGAGRTSIPVRPPSRMSTLSGIPTPTSTNSRPTTPSYDRSTTPTPSTTSSRMSWNNAPPLPTLAASSRRRTSSVYAPSSINTNLGATVRGRDRDSAEVEMRRPTSAIGPGTGLGVSSNKFPSTLGQGQPRAPGEGTNIMRRASLALGRSAMRKSSVSGGGK